MEDKIIGLIVSSLFT